MQLSDTPPLQPKAPRRNKVAEEKEALRTQLSTLVNRVPERVNAGSVQTTRQWVAENSKALKDVTRTRISRRALQESVARMQGWAK
jgi:hypothetical protein